MIDLSKITACVIDSGLFLDIAVRLQQDLGRVIFQQTIDQPFPKINELCIGQGIIETTPDFWKIKNEIDLFVVPDCHHAGLQLELASQGFPVWGSRNGVELELDRVGFKQVLKSLKLPVGPYEVCYGLDELREYLLEKEDCFIKVSRYRGNMETCHWIDWDSSSNIIDELAIQFGGLQNRVEFVVEDKIETEIEWGLDAYFCGGRFPSIVAHGIEAKDKCYVGAIQEWDKLPDEVLLIANALAPVMAEAGYCNFVSLEIRVDKEGTPYCTDFTARVPSPAGFTQMLAYDNLAEVMWHGARGTCLDPVPNSNHMVEVIMDHTGNEERWRKFVIPEKFIRNFNVCWACEDEGVTCIPPFVHSCDAIGSVAAVGDSVEDCVQKIKEIEKELCGQPVCLHTYDLIEALQEIEMADEQGIELSDQEPTEPEIVIDD